MAHPKPEIKIKKGFFRSLAFKFVLVLGAAGGTGLVIWKNSGETIGATAFHDGDSAKIAIPVPIPLDTAK